MMNECDNPTASIENKENSNFTNNDKIGTESTILQNNNEIVETTLTENVSNIDLNANPLSNGQNLSSSSSSSNYQQTVIDKSTYENMKTTQQTNCPPTLAVTSNQTEQIQNKLNVPQNHSALNVQGSKIQSSSQLQSRKSSIQSQAQSAILNVFKNSNNPNTLRNTSNVYNTNQAESFLIPIIGYEIMEERARFTIFKLRIDDPRTGLSWMVFRRYTDFVRLYSKLKAHHPNLILPMPGKRWFKDNFDPAFLEDRVNGLQIFVNAVIKKLYTDSMVRDFFCLDEPPPVCDAEPESLALFGALEDTVVSLKNQIRQKEETIDYLKKKVFYLEEKMKECNNCNAIQSTSIKSNMRSDKSMTSSSSGSSC